MQEGAFVDDDEGADWSKIIGSGVSVASGAMAGIEGYHKIRMASLGLSTEGAVIGGIKWAFVSDVLGAAGGMISIWDGLKKLTEANEANKTGQSLTGHYGMIVGGVGVLAGIASIVVISASTGVGLVVGVFFGILTLLLGYAFVAMVSPAVQMWVNRSILGKPSEREDMQVLPFDDMASEQSSLEMVFEGVMVEFSWSRVVSGANDAGVSDGLLGFSTSDLTDMSAPARNLLRIAVKISLPALRAVDLEARLRVSETRDYVFDWRYKKVEGGNQMLPTSGGSHSQGVHLSDQPAFECIDESYVLEWQGDYSIDEVGDKAELSVLVGDASLGFMKRDILEMRLG
ncbi:hypothetical protein GY26_19285 [Gammaproteobacteria bacterium MFB021]|nr:hypothetical protein GY26_19285 [Gammaproteobacteria bacterium MFB021]